MKRPSDAAQAILVVLVRHIDRGEFRADLPASFLGYGEVLDELRIRRDPTKTHGETLNEHGLDQLAYWAKDEDHTAVTGLVINKIEVQPGPGYWRLYGKDKKADRDWWLDQIDKALKYNWKPFLSLSDPASLAPAPVGASATEPPERMEVTISRIVRDSERAARVKHMHAHRCQFGCERLELKDGSYYSEAHHIWPLGRGGPDVIANLMCVCPNHHALLDLGAIPLDPTVLRKAGHHELDPAFIEYHNREIYGG